MQSTHDSVRAKVDQLRAALAAGTVDRDQLIGELTSETAPSIRETDDHRGGALHMCPWHTCKNTKFTTDAIARH
jgi:hypothetical protein